MASPTAILEAVYASKAELLQHLTALARGHNTAANMADLLKRVAKTDTSSWADPTTTVPATGLNPS